LYWRRVIKEQYGAEAPADASVSELVSLQSRLANLTLQRATGASTHRPVSVGVYAPGPTRAETPMYLGKLSSNAYDADSVSNPYGRYGSPYGQTIKNPYSPHGSPYSSTSATNSYATNTPRIYATDGTYLGKLSCNPYDPESISNPFGRYGNPYGNTLMNPYSSYGSPYSSKSWTNPYTNDAPRIYSPR